MVLLFPLDLDYLVVTTGTAAKRHQAVETDNVELGTACIGRLAEADL